MASINVPLRVLGDNILIKMTSKGIYDVWCAWCASLSLIRRKILSLQPQGFFHSFDISPNLQDWSCLSLSGVLYRPLELGAKPAFRWTTARRIFSCVYLAITGMYALYVKPNSKEMISISLARCQEIFFFWKDRRGQGQVESTPLVFGIWCFWFGFSLVLVK